MIDHLAEQFESLGFECEIIPIPGSETSKFNLIATLGSGPGGLVLAGHTDTVPLEKIQPAFEALLGGGSQVKVLVDPRL